MQNLELSDGEAAVLVRELTDITWNDRYPLSSRIMVLEEMLGMLRRAWRRLGFDHVLSRGGVPITSRARAAGCAVGWVRERDRVTMKIAGILLALVEVTSTAAAQTRGVPIAIPPPTIYSRPTPAPLAPPVNPGPAVVPPAGLSPLLTEPGPVFLPPQRAMPVHPSLQLPGPVGQQNIQAYRNSLLSQKWQRERRGISPGSERSREIQQQLNQTSPQ
jgi:hypothetical protein